MSRILWRFHFPVFHFKRKLEIIRIRVRTSSLPEPLRRNTTRDTRSLAQRAAGFHSRAFASFRVHRLLPLPLPISAVSALPLPCPFSSSTHLLFFIPFSSFQRSLSRQSSSSQAARTNPSSLLFSVFPRSSCLFSCLLLPLLDFLTSALGAFLPPPPRRDFLHQKNCLNETELICSLVCCWDSGVAVPSAQSPRHSVCLCARTWTFSRVWSCEKP